MTAAVLNDDLGGLRSLFVPVVPIFLSEGSSSLHIIVSYPNFIPIAILCLEARHTLHANRENVSDISRPDPK